MQTKPKEDPRPTVDEVNALREEILNHDPHAVPATLIVRMLDLMVALAPPAREAKPVATRGNE